MIPLHDDNPVSIKPIITITFIVICVCAFFWQISHNSQNQQALLYALGVVPAVLVGDAKLPSELVWIPTYFTIFSSMFLHGGWMHLIGNMLYLWVFGNNIEDSMGHVKFVIFYLLCGIAAVYAQAIPDSTSQIPMIGASGAISGVLGAYLLLFPKAKVLVGLPLGFYIHTMRIRAVWVLLFWFGLQIFNSVFTKQEGGGVAFGAHIGGFIAGLLLIGFFKHPSIKLHNPLSMLTKD